MSGPLESEKGELWTVWKHSGRSLKSPWRLLYSGEDESKARMVFETNRARLTFGALRILDPMGRDVGYEFGRVSA